MMDNDFNLLTQREIVDLLIGNTDTTPLPYMSGNDIRSLGKKFDDYPSVNDDALSRWMLMENTLHDSLKNTTTSDILEYLTSTEHLQPTIEEMNGNQILDSETVERHRLDIESKLLSRINDKLVFAKKKLIRNGSGFEILPIDVLPEVRVDTEHINVAYVKQLLNRAQDDLLDGDFDSVVTKSRTILEEVFIQIIKGHHIDFKKNGNIKQLRQKVVEALKMRPDDQWNPRIKKFVGQLNGLVDSIAELRNNDSDAHGSTDRIAITEAEAELIINTTGNIAIYFLRVNERQMR